MPIWPASTSFSNLRAVAPDCVKMAVPLPSDETAHGSSACGKVCIFEVVLSVHLLLLITLMASSRSLACTIVRTGPKISSLSDGRLCQ